MVQMCICKEGVKKCCNTDHALCATTELQSGLVYVGHCRYSGSHTVNSTSSASDSV